jgi:hypothetical protein
MDTMQLDPLTLLRGTSLPKGARRPRLAEGRRTCSVRGCDTVLSRYNLRATCHAHAPVRFPRNRGPRQAPDST